MYVFVSYHSAIELVDRYLENNGIRRRAGDSGNLSRRRSKHLEKRGAKTRTVGRTNPTGLGGFFHLLPLSYGALICLYAFWGVSSLFAFWPCCIKAVRIL